MNEFEITTQQIKEGKVSLPPKVLFSSYKVSVPLVKPSKIYEMGGWVINFAVGCTFGCKFCYVDEIHKKFSLKRIGEIVLNEWGYYFAVPSNLNEAIEETPWEKWRGKEVMMSSTHDPYLPQLYKWARRILEKALPAGLRINILTRSPLVERDFDLLLKYKRQVSVNVSIATMDEAFSRIIEPRVVNPKRRLEIIRKAKNLALRTGVHVAPICPPNRIRPDLEQDIDLLAKELYVIKPDAISAESLHIRGKNISYMRNAIGEEVSLLGFEEKAKNVFCRTMEKYGLSYEWD